MASEKPHAVTVDAGDAPDLCPGFMLGTVSSGRGKFHLWTQNYPGSTSWTTSMCTLYGKPNLVGPLTKDGAKSNDVCSHCLEAFWKIRHLSADARRRRVESRRRGVHIIEDEED